jgi:hypothetical protein
MPEPNPRAETRRKRATFLLIILAALSVLVPYLFWQGTWFGRSLTDEELGQYLSDQEKPRHIQHALVQIAERIERGDPGVERWYSQVAALRESSITELRVTLAWMMGADNRSELFHQTLLSLLEDAEPMVRLNAALSLVRFGDASGRQEIAGLLRSQSISAPAAGTLRHQVAEGASVDQGALLARVETPGGTPTEVRAPMPGEIQRWVVADGAAVTAEQEVLVLSPAEGLAWEALRALYLVGEKEDLAAVEAFVEANASDLSEKLRQQASLTAAEIRRRSSVTQ